MQRQAAGSGQGADRPEDVQAAANRGISGARGQLPHLGAIQRSFGRHDVSHVQAHVGGAAAEAGQAMGAAAFATGNHVGFTDRPGLHTAAHEAAHVVQQQAGVALEGGVGKVGDRYEQHADRVADKVVAGQSAEGLLDQAVGQGGGAGVQRSVGPVQMRTAATRDREEAQRRFSMPTWDSKAVDPETGEKGAWVDAEPESGSHEGMHEDKQGKYGDNRQVRGVARNPEEESQLLNNGRLSEMHVAGVSAKAAAQIDPLSDAPKKILKNTFGQSWNRAKHATVGKGAGPEMVMKKLWEYRQWHHDEILKRTQKEVGSEALTTWAAAGSTTLTSDIDVNMKGKNTEKAVEVFNRKFKQDGFDYEAGVVYDVNVYALDFLHVDTFKGVRRGDDRVSAQEGIRSGQKAGGINPGMDDRQILANADDRAQEIWSLVKMRIYMTPEQWAQHKAEVNASDDPDKKAKFQEVEIRYRAYCDTLIQEMEGQTNTTLERADEQDRTGIQVIERAAKSGSGGDDTKAENLQIGASNRIYERKLMEMKELRNLVRKQVGYREHNLAAGRHEKAQELEEAINGNLVILRDLISECALYSNEAYVTDAGVNHAVVGLQSEIAIKQTKAQGRHAFNENVADTLKEMARHGHTVGEAAYKAGKYMWRLGDAARNMGAGGVGTVQKFYSAGYKLANEIKGKELPSGQTHTGLAFAAIRESFGIDSDNGAGVQTLMAIARTLAVDVNNWFDKNVSGQGKQHELGTEINHKKH